MENHLSLILRSNSIEICNSSNQMQTDKYIYSRPGVNDFKQELLKDVQS